MTYERMSSSISYRRHGDWCSDIIVWMLVRPITQPEPNFMVLKVTRLLKKATAQELEATSNHHN